MLYHKDVFLPKRIKSAVPQGKKGLVYSAHAKAASCDDKYGRIPLLSEIDFHSCEIIEVEHYSSGVQKVVVRKALDENRHIVIVASPSDCGEWVARTVWINLATDTHRTLDKRLYAKAS